MKAVGRTVAKNFVKSVSKSSSVRNLNKTATSTFNQTSNVKTATFSMPPRIQYTMNSPSVAFGNKPPMDPVSPKGENNQGYAFIF